MMHFASGADFFKPVGVTPEQLFRDPLSGETFNFSEWARRFSGAASRVFGMTVRDPGSAWALEAVRAGRLEPVKVKKPVKHWGRRRRRGGR